MLQWAFDSFVSKTIQRARTLHPSRNQLINASTNPINQWLTYLVNKKINFLEKKILFTARNLLSRSSAVRNQWISQLSDNGCVHPCATLVGQSPTGWPSSGQWPRLVGDQIFLVVYNCSLMSYNYFIWRFYCSNF